MSQPPVTIIAAIIAKAPQWIKHDLGSKDPAIRERAEESLAARIADVLNKTAGTPPTN